MVKQNHAVNPGDLDPEFGGDGIVDVPDDGTIRGVVEDGEGRFVYVLWSYEKTKANVGCIAALQTDLGIFNLAKTVSPSGLSQMGWSRFRTN